MSHAILEHAKTCLSHLGRIELRAVARDSNGVWRGTIVVTTPDSIEYYTGFSVHDAVSLIKTRTECLPTLPLLGGQ